MSNSQRHVHLKSCLSGPPEKLIKSLSSTDSKYETARNLLEQRYKNNRIILRTLQARAADFKPERAEGKYQLRLLQSTFNEVTQSIHSLGRQVDNDMWHHLPFTKLDANSKKAWALKNEFTECLKFDELITFLDNRVRSMEMLPTPPKQLHVTGRDERSKQSSKHPFVVTQCKESHAPCAYSKFKDLSAKDKQSAIAASKSCQNCLRFNHESDQCSSKSRCKTCQW